MFKNPDDIKLRPQFLIACNSTKQLCPFLQQSKFVYLNCPIMHGESQSPGEVTQRNLFNVVTGTE